MRAILTLVTGALMALGAKLRVPSLASASVPRNMRLVCQRRLGLTLGVTVAFFLVGSGSAWACTAGNFRNLAIRSEANHKYVSAELGYASGDSRYGMLRARAATIGPWERFRIRCLGGNSVAIQSRANGRYVSAELGYSSGDSRYGMLRARATTIGPWERFSLPDGNSIYAQNSWTDILFGPNMSNLISAELGYSTGDYRYGMLRARGTSVGAWEVFGFVPA